MSSLFKKPAPPGSGPSRPRFASKPNAARALRERQERRGSNATLASGPAAGGSSAGNGGKKSSSPAVATSRQQCPNKQCEKPNVVDGICQTCGRVADDSNIVAEVQFGETSSGAAVVQGSFIGADQAGVRSMGPAFRRVGGTEDREKSIREAKGLMQGYAQQLNVSESLVTSGTQVFKLASSANFIQGRTLASVAAVCLYAACRAEPPCKLMLIDLADLVQLNVFKLGRIFKKLNEVVPLASDCLVPVYPEDLIWRFATKMEFHSETARVAEDAVRLVKRMSRDWMVMGRRPSGICGACLLMAARMHNFRRTVREVVYIVKVTNHTIQNRLAEFKFTESSQMSVEDFLKQDFLESSHDPPSFYRTSEEYKKMVEEKSRKRKRTSVADGDEEGTDSEQPEESEQRRRRTMPSGADLSKAPIIEYRRDQDGFIIPPLPSKILPSTEDTSKAHDANENEGDNETENLEELARDFGDEIDEELDRQTSGARGKRSQSLLPINDAWKQDEEELEGEMEEIFNDPLTREHALAYSNAEQRAHIHSHWALLQAPHRDVPMSVVIGEDEFANDPEVINCMLDPAEARIKETIWVNQNKEWLRSHQEKVFRRKMEAERPKQTRRRRKRARMGEGQTSPASSAAEAALGVIKDRGWSSRINYDAIRYIFDAPGSGPGGPGSAATSRKTSMAGSVVESLAGSVDKERAEDEEDVDEGVAEQQEVEDMDDDEDMDEQYGLYDDEEFS